MATLLLLPHNCRRLKEAAGFCGTRVPPAAAPAGHRHTHTSGMRQACHRAPVRSARVPLSSSCSIFCRQRFTAGSRIKALLLCSVSLSVWAVRHSWAQSHCREHHQIYKTEGVVSLPWRVYSRPFISHFPKPHHPVCIQSTVSQPAVRVLLNEGCTVLHGQDKLLTKIKNRRRILMQTSPLPLSTTCKFLLLKDKHYGNNKHILMYIEANIKCINLRDKYWYCFVHVNI